MIEFNETKTAINNNTNSKDKNINSRINSNIENTDSKDKNIDRDRDMFWHFIESGSWFILVLLVVFTFLYILKLKDIVAPLLGFMILIFLFYLVYSFKDKKKIKITIRFFILIFILLVVSSSYVFHHEPLMGDHDVGVFSLSALKYYYSGEVVEHGFPPYSVFISLPLFLGDSFFNIYIMNAVVIFFGLGIIYYISKLISSKSSVHMFTIFSITLTYPFLWFSRRTLTEVLWFFLFFMSLYYIFKYNETNKPKYILFAFCPMIFSLSLRIEAYIFMILIGVYTFWLLYDNYISNVKDVKSKLFGKRNKLTLKDKFAFCFRQLWHFFKKNKFAFVLLLVISAISFFFISLKYWYVLGPFLKALANIFQKRHIWEKTPAVYNPLLDDVSYDTSPPTYKTYILKYVFQTFDKYFLLLPLIFVFMYLILTIFRDKRRVKNILRDNLFLGSIIVVLFFTFLIVETSTGFTQPWFLRHFWVPVITLSFLICFPIMDMLIKSKEIKYIIWVLMVAILLSVSFPLFSFSEYKGSYKMMKQFSDSIYQDISDEDQEILIITENELYKNYGLSLSYLVNAELCTLNDLNCYNKSSINGTKAYLFIQPKDPSTLKINDSYNLEKKICSEITVKRLKYLRAAHDYAKNWRVPPIHLTKGYEPFEETIEQTPPKEFFDYKLGFCLYKLT